jgi:hypothetical protein
MLTTAPAPTAAQLAKIAELEARATRAVEAERESFDRCDTDGFLSQWSHSMTRDLAQANARILENGGHAPFPVLCDASGEVLATVVFTFENPHPRGWGIQCRDMWRLGDALAEKHGRKWVPCGSGSRVQKQLGLHEETRWFPAFAKLTVGRGQRSTGLGGCANAFVATFRIRDAEDQREANKELAR